MLGDVTKRCQFVFSRIGEKGDTVRLCITCCNNSLYDVISCLGHHDGLVESLEIVQLCKVLNFIISS